MARRASRYGQQHGQRHGGDGGERCQAQQVGPCSPKTVASPRTAARRLGACAERANSLDALHRHGKLVAAQRHGGDEPGTLAWFQHLPHLIDRLPYIADLDDPAAPGGARQFLAIHNPFGILQQA